MFGIEMNKQVFATILSTTLLFDCIFVNLKYEAEYRFVYSLFPPKFYQTVLSETKMSKNHCALFDTCKTEKKQYSNPRCYCDSACKEYNDCCFDANFNDTSEQMKLQHIGKELYNCETNSFYNPFYGFLLVSDCPAYYDLPEVIEKCKLKDNVHPVSVDDGITFRNVYCAYCHNVRKYKAWRLEYKYTGKCSHERVKLLTTIPIKMRYVIENDCHYGFLPPATATARSCLKNVIGEDANNGFCSEFQSPVVIDYKLYRNIYCYNSSIGTTRPMCILPLFGNSYEQKNYGSLTLTGIFNIQPLFEINKEKTCKENFHYDRIKDACVPMTCREDEDETCSAELIRNFKWVISLDFVTDNIIDKSFILRLAAFQFLFLPHERYKIRVTGVKGHYECYRNETYIENSCCIGNEIIYFSNGIEMSEETTQKFKTKVRNIKWAYTETGISTNVSAFDVLENTYLTNACNTFGSAVFNDAFSEYGSLISSIKQQIVVNITRTPPLEIPERVEGVLVISEGKGAFPGLRLEKWNLQFETKNENNQTSLTTIGYPGPDITNNWSVATILTYSTLGMSCCFLLLTLFAYSYFGLFQSTSGIISKYMMATMLAAQLLFMIGVGATYAKPVCTAIGIVLHYLWLTSFTWISIFLFSVLKMMRTLYKCPGTLTERQKLSRGIYFLGFILPLVIVFPCAMLDIFSNVDIGYSDGTICFPTGPVANLFSFTLPVIVLLCFNIVTLVVTSVSISKYNSTVYLLQSVRQMRSFIPIYLRLSILCACPWILGIVADILQLDSLRYIFIILAGSHGTFVRISFLLAESIRKRVRCGRFKEPTNDTELRNKRTSVPLTD